LIKKINDRKKR